MPYYCTVPRCTSMAGKAKNVSFHQFPRDEELARLWNKILKRGKPYTKYSKVCSLHFRQEDYTITSVGKNKGQWRTLRKDAIPSQNLPSESPVPCPQRNRNTGAWITSNGPSVLDPRMQQQMAQAIYMQTMLAMQAATNGTPSMPAQNANIPNSHPTDTLAHTSSISLSEIEQILQKNLPRNNIERMNENQEIQMQESRNITSYKCEDCSKCFKDPDVFILHRRSHSKTVNTQEKSNSLSTNEKENFNSNNDNKQETLRANPILANLLKSGITQSNDIPDTITNGFSSIFDASNILSIENQIMAALTANMESYIRNLSSMLSQQVTKEEIERSSDEGENEVSDGNIDRVSKVINGSDVVRCKAIEGSAQEPDCDNEDLSDSKDSNNLVIDEHM